MNPLVSSDAGRTPPAVDLVVLRVAESQLPESGMADYLIEEAARLEDELGSGFRMASGASRGGLGHPLQLDTFVLYIADVVTVAVAAANLAKFVAWIRQKGFDIRIDESGIDVLARAELERRGHDRDVSRISIVRVPTEEAYLATYQLGDGRLALLRYAYDSILLTYEETGTTVIEDSTANGFDPTAYYDRER